MNLDQEPSLILFIINCSFYNQKPDSPSNHYHILEYDSGFHPTAFRSLIKIHTHISIYGCEINFYDFIYFELSMINLAIKFII